MRAICNDRSLPQQLQYKSPIPLALKAMTVSPVCLGYAHVYMVGGMNSMCVHEGQRRTSDVLLDHPPPYSFEAGSLT